MTEQDNGKVLLDIFEWDSHKKNLQEARNALSARSLELEAARRERDEARDQVQHLGDAREALDEARAEIARLRAAANERAIAELSAFRGWAESDGDWSLEHGGVAYGKVVGRVIERIAALRAEQPAAPVPPPVTPPADAPSRPSVEEFCEMSFRIDLDEIISIAKTAGSDCPTPLWMLEAAAEYLPKKRDALIAKTKAAFDAIAARGGA